MIVNFFNFSKRPNSTAEPPGNDPTRTTLTDVQLKEETSFLNPTLLISRNATQSVFNPVMFNYAEIAIWQRYYFITDCRWVNSVWEIDLTVDPLASFKSAIGDTEAYIIRSATTYNTDLIDTFYPGSSHVYITRQGISTDIYGVALGSGCYVVGVINNETSNRVGSVTYYALTNAQLASLLAYLFSGSIYSASNVYDVSEGLYKSMFDPFQYIVSCMWFPIAQTVIGSTTVNIKVGYWDTGVQGKIASTLIKEWRIVSQSSIRPHPQASRGKYLNRAPYTRLTAYIPPFGEIPIDANYMVYDTNWLYGKLNADFITGIADLRLTITNNYTSGGEGFDDYKFCTQRTSQLGVPIQLSQVMTDYVQALSSGASTIASGFAGNIAGIFSGIGNSAASLFPKTSSLGSNGSFLEVAEPPVLVVESVMVADENRKEFGRPLCNTMQIKYLSGYVQCGEEDHAFPCTATEKQMINKHLKDGFFYE